MNRKRNRIDKAIDRPMDRGMKAVVWGTLGLLFLGLIRIHAYAWGAHLVHHWYDSPARWLIHLMR